MSEEIKNVTIRIEVSEKTKKQIQALIPLFAEDEKKMSIAMGKVVEKVFEENGGKYAEKLFA